MSNLKKYIYNLYFLNYSLYLPLVSNWKLNLWIFKPKDGNYDSKIYTINESYDLQIFKVWTNSTFKQARAKTPLMQGPIENIYIAVEY